MSEQEKLIAELRAYAGSRPGVAQAGFVTVAATDLEAYATALEGVMGEREIYRRALLAISDVSTDFGAQDRAEEALQEVAALSSLPAIVGNQALRSSVAMSGGTPTAKSEGLCKSERDTFLDICDRLQDDGDRVYLGSTNDAEALRALGRRVWAAS